MDVSIWAILFLMAAVLLLFAEVLIPSGGIIFAVAMCCLALACISAWNAWYEKNPWMWWGFIVSVLVLLPTSVGAAIYVWPHTPIGRAMEPPTEEEVTPYVAEQKRLEKLIGQIGEALTPQNPAGITRVDGQKVHSLSEGMIIHSGEPVRVLAVRGNRIIVRRVPPEEVAASESEPESSSPRHENEGSSSLDFDLPG